MRATTRAAGAADLLGLAALVVLVGLLLYATGRPIFTDDVWWHLALGRAYLGQGPWLDADPLLFAAQGPPAPAAWLFDALLFGLLDAGGFGTLRVFHVLAVAGTLLLAWRALRSGEAPRSAAALGTGVFLVLGAYRLFQLRPELASIASTLALYTLLLASPRAPSMPRIALAAGLCALWANLHAGFLLGPILLGAALFAIVLSLPFQLPSRRAIQRKRAMRLAAALGACLVATLANPEGPSAHLAYFVAGDTTPDLSVVGDEWSPLDLFALPPPSMPPAPLVWALTWALILITCTSAWLAWRSWRDTGETRWIDPALLGLAAAGLAAPLLAVRFTWLAFFSVLLGIRAARPGLPRVSARWAAAALGVLLIPGFLAQGDWPFLSRGVPRDLAGYGRPYPAHKYFANAAWFLRDTGVEGRLFTNYYQGGFFGLWLAPEVRLFINGSLNLPQTAVHDYLAIQTGYGLGSRRELLERLDAHEIDFFLGTALPSLSPGNRPWRYTTVHLEGAPGWLLVYRNIQMALYLRATPRNAPQLERIARYYERQGVPFDLVRGLDVGAALDHATDWAIREGLVPTRYRDLVGRSNPPPGERNKLANVYTGLGLYDRALEIGHDLTRTRREIPEAARRRVWCLLRLGQMDRALQASQALGRDPLSRYLAAETTRIAALEDPSARALQLAFVPLYTRDEAARVASGRTPTAARPFAAP